MESQDLGLLVSLDALLSESSVTKAARRLGLSTPAMSHALAKIRERLGDPILVRAGRAMVLTPRALAMKERVHDVVRAAELALEPERPFVARDLRRVFVVHASDYVVSILGAALDRILTREAPRVSLRFVPNTTDDPASLREQNSDLAVGIYGELPPELRSRQLLTDRFVCVVRKDHTLAQKRLSLADFVASPHVQVAPRGKPGGYIDDELRTRGLSRNVARAVPFFLAALHLTSESDYILTISERVARKHAPILGLAILEVPLKLRPYALSLLWHPRVDGDAGHRFLRDAVLRAAKEVAFEKHEAPRTRLDATDPTSGQTRKRAKPRTHAAKNPKF